MINIDHLSKSYGKLIVLDDINLTFMDAQAVSLLGPNGSGKTTLIKSILGLVISQKGSITINGELVSNDEKYRSQIGYMPQIGRYPDNMTIKQVINMIKELRKDCKYYDEDLIKEFGIEKFQNKTMRSLSGGTRQKISACIAFLFSPNIFILDEPTAGLDPLASEIFKEKIISERKLGKIILITSHVLSDLDDITSHIVYLQDGKLMFYDSVDNLKLETGEERLNKVLASKMKKMVLNN